MSTLALEDIKAEHTKLAEMIATFEAQASAKPSFPVTIEQPELYANEIWVGAILGSDGRRYHLVLLPGKKSDTTWEAAIDWAHSLGGELPDRVESALLFATQKDQFKQEAYWTRDVHASAASFAWFQHFGLGVQFSSHADDQLRARAVRRLPI